MPLAADEFTPSDGLWDLVSVAIGRGAARLTHPAGWVLVVSERERHEDEAPEPDWGNPDARFDTAELPSVDEARRRAHDLLAPGGAWRAAVVWRERDRLVIEAQDAETDSLAGRFIVPIEQRKRALRSAEPILGEREFPEPIAPLRTPTWNGTTWTLRTGDRVVAELHVTSTNWSYLLATVTAQPGLEEVLPASPYRQAPIGAWSLHQPDGSRVDAVELELDRQTAGWTWKGAFEGPERDPVRAPDRSA